jgi:glycosyltransferase involved in cell wall biosynthesis
MVFIGPINADYKKYLVNLCSNKKRLIFIGQMPYVDLFSYTVDADISFTMIKPINFNFLNMAGASNKRYEMMTCGVPQISNIGPGMKELIEDNVVGVCIDPDDVSNITRAVNMLLANKEIRVSMSENGRKKHLELFNYELEFRPVIDKITKWCLYG